MSNTIKIEGLEKTMSRFDIKKYEPQIQAAFDKFGFRVETAAKLAAPVYDGNLKSSIHSTSYPLASLITVTANYASYVEFGTRKYAAAYVSSLPTQWQEYAASTRGKSTGSGTMDEFIQNIMAWVRTKGIGGQRTRNGNVSESKKSLSDMQQAAYAIALNILQNGIKPHPYIYPAFNTAQKQLIKDLQELTYESTGFQKQSLSRRSFR